jgi:anti-sigma factor ChrR (cupin superfamily)
VVRAATIGHTVRSEANATMTHDELRDLLPLLALDVLAADERQALDTHLNAGCVDCNAELRLHRQTAAALAHDVPAVTPPASLRERVLQACLTSGAEPAPVARVWRDWAPLPAAAEGGSTIVRADEGRWENVLPGVAVKRLSLDAARRSATMLVRMLAGSEYPRHRHAHAEECLVLAGDLRIGDDIVMHTGDFQRAESGSTHLRQWTETGCTLLVTSSLDDELD